MSKISSSNFLSLSILSIFKKSLAANLANPYQRLCRNANYYCAKRANCVELFSSAQECNEGCERVSGKPQMKYVVIALLLAGCGNMRDNTTVSDKLVIAGALSVIAVGAVSIGN